MSRQKDFRQEAIDYDDSPDLVQRIIARTGFEIGCEHGYQYAIEKAEKWIKENVLEFEHQSFVHEFDDCIKDFRKAMEE